MMQLLYSVPSAQCIVHKACKYICLLKGFRRKQKMKEKIAQFGDNCHLKWG